MLRLGNLEMDDVPLCEVGELANLVRERHSGNRAYYNINTHLNPTNVCVYRCIFCAFRSDLRDAMPCFHLCVKPLTVR